LSDEEIKFVWVFNGEKSNLPSAVFSSREVAEDCIRRISLTGLLTKYPVDMCAYDWSVSNGFFKPSKERHYDSAFIGTFSGGEEHFHYENGVLARNTSFFICNKGTASAGPKQSPIGDGL
jgi:hypothetical protein